MTGNVIKGNLKGLKMQELPVSQKMMWRDWKKLYPDTEVLSVHGKEDARDSYRRYFESDAGFRNASANDKRLKTKAPVFAFRFQGLSYAVPHQRLENGAVFEVDDRWIFLYRPVNAALFVSTHAFIGPKETFTKEQNLWTISETASTFHPQNGMWSEKQQIITPLTGFDTFWYNWSLSNPKTKILKKSVAGGN